MALGIEVPLAQRFLAENIICFQVQLEFFFSQLANNDELDQKFPPIILCVCLML